MEVLIFLYNILLIMFYATISTLSFTYFLKNKKFVFLVTSLLFVVNIFDNTIIYMTEFIEWFSRSYNSQFLMIPAFKTVILLSYSTGILLISNAILKRKNMFFPYILLLGQGLMLMFIPMMDNSAYKVWLYYLPCQLFQFWLSLDGLHQLRTKTSSYQEHVYRHFRQILRITLVFSILILIEDTIVIFNFDSYTDLLVRINNRNMCEDLLSIIYGVMLIRYLYERMKSEQNIPVIAAELADSEYVQAETAAVSAPAMEPEPAFIPAPPTAFELFCLEYNLTTREKEIFTLLITNKSNQEICEELAISIGTVKTHVHNIFNKLGVSKRHQVIQSYQEYIYNAGKAELKHD